MLKAPEIESAVLGLALTDSKACVTMLSMLSVEDFTDRHQQVFTGIHELFHEDAPVNAATIRNWIEERNLSDQVGGIGVADSLMEAAKGVKAEGIETACSYLKRYTVKRKFKDLCFSYSQRCDDRDEDIEALLAEAGSDFFSLLSGQGDHESDSGEGVDEVVEDVQTPIDYSDRVYTGTDVDKITNGFRPGELIILAGKTSHGKSAFAQNIILNAIKKHGHSCLVTMEMTRREVNERILSMHSDVLLEKITEHTVTDEEYRTLKGTRESIKNMPYGYTVIDDAGMDVEKLYATARRMKLVRDTKLIVVDYLQQLGSKGDTREQEVAHIAKTLKRIAHDVNCVVIALSQFNRASSHTERPQLNQLRESGAIEHYANKALLLWNPIVDGVERFSDSESEGKWRGKPTTGVMEINVAKNRGGRVGMVKIGFDPERQKVYNLAPEPKHAMDYL